MAPAEGDQENVAVTGAPVAPSAGEAREKEPGAVQVVPATRKEKTADDDVFVGSHAACAVTDQK